MPAAQTLLLIAPRQTEAAPVTNFAALAADVDEFGRERRSDKRRDSRERDRDHSKRSRDRDRERDREREKGREGGGLHRRGSGNGSFGFDGEGEAYLRYAAQ
ncbi:hypothetical protein JKP88DRAFT_253229 [Tribonema minus]|uniref:Uncharacterized protein n=1 Tax=Tribonema minus TaxID=303371 RepID=A0A836CKM2_9STRA|nr:hypothetical protein JKP88DRAFT_253229 [Tribonema minus]